MHRRQLLSSLPLGLVLLAGCQTGAGSGTPATVIGFLKGAADTLTGAGAAGPPGLLQAISTADPALISPQQLASVLPGLQTAETLLAGLTPQTLPAQSASTIRQVEGYLNAGMKLLVGVSSAVPALAPYVPLIDAVTIAIQIGENFVTQYIPTAAAIAPHVAALRHQAAQHAMTRSKAAELLGVKQ